jgi:NADH-quinone oxidoreductase subunit G
MLRMDGFWREVSWETALEATADGLRDIVRNGRARTSGFLGSPSATTEELFLLGRLARGIGSHNIDTRLRQQDFTDQEHDPVWPGSGHALAGLEALDGLLLAGCHVRQEAPLIAHRVRKAALRGARVSLIATAAQECHFPVAREIVVDAADLLAEFAALLQAAVARRGQPAPASVAALAASTSPTDAHRGIVESLAAGRGAIVLGGAAMRHTRYADLRAAAAALATLTGATLGYLPDGGNAAGAALAGALPHRLPGGGPGPRPGLNARQMLESTLAACVLFGGIEPEHDLGPADASIRLSACPNVIAITPFAGGSLMSIARILLPMGSFAETSGTYVNIEGRWQEFLGCARLVGEARPGWKILRVLGNLLGLDGFDYESSASILGELRELAGQARYDGRFHGRRVIEAKRGGTTTVLPIYGVDAIVRRASALQLTRAARAGTAG